MSHFLEMAPAMEKTIIHLNVIMTMVIALILIMITLIAMSVNPTILVMVGVMVLTIIQRSADSMVMTV